MEGEHFDYGRRAITSDLVDRISNPLVLFWSKREMYPGFWVTVGVGTIELVGDIFIASILRTLEGFRTEHPCQWFRAHNTHNTLVLDGHQP